MKFWRRVGMMLGLVPKPCFKLAAPISTKDIPADRPDFKREYTSKLTPNAKITIDIHTDMFGNRNNKFGTLIQPNGNRVDFDPTRIADKILRLDNIHPNLLIFHTQVENK